MIIINRFNNEFIFRIYIAAFSENNQGYLMTNDKGVILYCTKLFLYLQSNF